ncbi:hypothetical protein [Bordetella hinzii]|uniref:N-acetyltransferase YedL n=1 Tax=Bordetella hinzii OH87 BAL007II TaxID=1331262 RepID=A0ABR4R5L7_9BORD|nr:hypothetical protein [Bordetella hinzii]KCB25979.1 hypothetical protein L544_3155 [Bordetella hinzii OH87 BAL007II]KCB31171.1 hypothetical protein L543_3044 [Bordetella hinzii L60]KCB32582.1 hypothetical protein L541_3244 [Bordetella hinzii CA90 BAL1384]KCB39676.1 hypothetical protein L539_3447 [Bordetella hinzii 5132]KCB49387.1 hypothetical protein L538_3215 [Bordetella hinzii 4161]
MRPHNGWWKNTSTPRRWLDAMRAAARQPSSQEAAAALPAKPAQANA